MIDFFLRRPIFASVCSLVILLLGLVSIPILPIAQYPNIAPPTVTVTSVYTGASAEAVEASVTTPLEQAINTVQGLRYISSQSGSDGTSTITCTFALDRDLDQAANDVQNAVNLAQGNIPNEVKQVGITVSKNSGTFVMALGVTSTDPRWDPIYMTNYLENNVTNDLQRISGVSQVFVFGERKYAMRLWIDPKRLADNGLTAGDVVTALQAQNVQVAAGAIGAPPTNGNQPYEYGVRATGRLQNTTQFANIILRSNPDGGYVRVRDVGRVTLGAANYGGSLWFDGREGVGLGILQLQSGNALQVSQQIRSTLDRLQQKFPAGMTYHIAFDSTEFVRESIREVVITLLIAVLLVVLVIFLFLQDWRTTLIPAVTIPVSLIGTFFLMKVFGFSINTLTLFGLTLATGLVVDDAIVVIENIARFIQEKGLPPLEGAREAMREIFGAVLASSLSLLAVFIPVAFFPGTTGLLYKQFAITIACAITISLFNALTLTPVLSALLLRKRTRVPRVFGPINAAISGTRRAYHGMLPAVLRVRFLVVAVFVAALAFTGWAYLKMPTGFIPDEDQGFMIVILQAPESYSLDQTHRVQRKVEAILRQQPEITDLFDAGGFSFTGNGSNLATMFVRLKPWAEREGAQHSLDAVLQRVNMQLYFLPDAQVFAFNPPAIPGLGFAGGFTFELEDRAGNGLPALLQSAYQVIGPANAPNSGLSRVYTTFRLDKPTVLVDVDRDKALSLGVDLGSIFSTMQVYLGSVYVNDFDMQGRTYRVYVQADTPYRSRVSDLSQIYVRSGTPIPSLDPTTGLTVQQQAPAIPLSALVTLHEVKDPQTITHFNLYRSVEIGGNTAPGYGTGHSIATMDHLADQLPPGYGYEWSGIAREQVEGGAQAVLIFALGIIFVFLVLAAQYESFGDPLIILFAVPLALLGAIGGLWLRHYVSDVFAQVGYVMLIGLAAKNAILIVEFANQLREQGVDMFTAVTRAAETRFRPILMTSIAFVLGVTPLVFASGAGSAARHSIGTVVFFGMIVSTILNLVVTPVLYVMIASIENRFGVRRGGHRPPDGPDDFERPFSSETAPARV
jgi:HAE1 family hydrophobic/amphiphilic exporter-1